MASLLYETSDYRRIHFICDHSTRKRCRLDLTPTCKGVKEILVVYRESEILERFCHQRKDTLESYIHV
jgi:hypothetical protein